MVFATAELVILIAWWLFRVSQSVISRWLLHVSRANDRQVRKIQIP